MDAFPYTRTRKTTSVTFVSGQTIPNCTVDCGKHIHWTNHMLTHGYWLGDFIKWKSWA